MRIPGTTFSDDGPSTPEEISYERFKQVDLRVGKILEAEAVPKSNKLLKLKVSFGAFERQVIAGLGLTFKPEDLIGKKAAFVVNLARREVIKGYMSEAMILACGSPESLALVSFDGDVTEGSYIG